MAKPRLDNDVTDHIGLVYVENDTELSGLIGPSAVCDKTRQNNSVKDLLCGVYAENETKLSWQIELGAVCHEN